MKFSQKLFRRLLAVGLVAIAFSLTTVLAGTLGVQSKGASKLMKPITSSRDIAALQSGDLVAMACPKCKTITLNYVTTEKGHMETTAPGEEHLCPGCGQKFVVVGQGKGKHDTITHVCKECGSTNAFCCVLRAGAPPTKGMGPKT